MAWVRREERREREGRSEKEDEGGDGVGKQRERRRQMRCALNACLSLLCAEGQTASSMKELQRCPIFTPAGVSHDLQQLEGKADALTKEAEGLMRERGERMSEVAAAGEIAQVSRTLWIYFVLKPEAIPRLLLHYTRKLSD